MPDPDFRTDHLVLVATNPHQYASWGKTLTFHARLVNLTNQEITTTGVGAGITQIKHGQFLKQENWLPSVVATRFVSEPYHVLTVEMNPDNFNRQDPIHVAIMNVSYDFNGQTYSSAEVVWYVEMR